ncbi:tripartite motif-containing protein 14 isoform X2 [Denticeps clupeoides]|uniref:tripartite motif-containing protein 14 isoform X2 n=1 Tax=Denticeps clupeoides TaxID=299321 RepID=UPI0010A462A6|nr:tripartite motif-containing protein 14-like isoform X2 [Denticeps clupeoides]
MRQLVMMDTDNDTAPSGDLEDKLTLTTTGLESHVLSEDLPIQPYPRSPKLLRKITEISGRLAQEQLSKNLHELKAERQKTEAHLESLKKRRANLTSNMEAMKQELKARFDDIHDALQRDEQTVLDSLEVDRRETSSKLTRVIKDWTQHLNQVQKNITNIQTALEKKEPQDLPEEFSQKKPCTAEDNIKLNEDRFQKLLKTLQRISKDLQGQLQRKSFLLDSANVVIDRETSHKHVLVTRKGQSLCVSTELRPSQQQQHPLQFDKVYCALGTVAIAKGQHYWEVNVTCCPNWAVGVAYVSLQRKGNDKNAKLGRNCNSWCVELRDGNLTAWHNDRYVALTGSVGRKPPSIVGVIVNYEKGRVAFYDGGTMTLLHEFSATLNPVFNQAHHHFTEPLYPAIRFLKPQEAHVGPIHIEIANLQI